MGDAMRFRVKVRHYEVDGYGHVNHASYVHYLELARIEALEAVGLSLDAMRQQGYLIVATALSVKYHAPAHAGETMVIITSLKELRGVRSVWVQEMREAESRRLVVTAEVVGALVTERGRPARTPAAFADRLAGILVPGARVDAASLEPVPVTRRWCLCRDGRFAGAVPAKRKAGG